MVDVPKLKSIFVLNEKTYKDVANLLNMSEKTFSLRMKNGVFGSDEIETMIDYFNIEDPMSVFFKKKVTS